MHKKWYVYIVQCVDGSLYTGITVDLDRRLNEHNTSNKGAKYTRSRRPVQMMYSETHETRSLASKREYAIKQLTRKEKLNLLKINA
jgi:putative endonuclease|tara:strand:+ start:72 stop:329 length:258 start_codon:yes stop_codon:yes gene_type:complete